MSWQAVELNNDMGVHTTQTINIKDTLINYLCTLISIISFYHIY